MTTRRIISIVGSGVLMAFVFLPPVQGKTTSLSSCDRQTVQNAVDAAADGDTILLPAGTCSYSSPVVVNKPVSILGAGIDVTTIQDNSSAQGTFQLRSSGFVRLSGFTLTGSAGSWNGSVRLNADNTRVDHIRFSQSNGRHPVGVGGNRSNAVIDHCVFEPPGEGINIFGEQDYWTDPSQYAPGTKYGVYIEDCVFNKGGVEIVDLNYGGAYVIRHSVINNGGNVAMHGADSGVRAGGYAEIYDNQFVNPGSGSKAFAVVLRGGTSIIFNNTITGRYNVAWDLQNWRSCYPAGGLPFHSDNANPCEHNSVNPLDGDYSPENNGWPCKDQIGRGPNQMSAPSYSWNNTWDRGVAEYNVADVGGCGIAQQLHILEGRDFFNGTPKPGYTPYPYPHPLITGNPAPPPDTSAPAAPTNLRVTNQE